MKYIVTNGCHKEEMPRHQELSEAEKRLFFSLQKFTGRVVANEQQYMALLKDIQITVGRYNKFHSHEGEVAISETGFIDESIFNGDRPSDILLKVFISISKKKRNIISWRFRLTLLQVRGGQISLCKKKARTEDKGRATDAIIRHVENRKLWEKTTITAKRLSPLERLALRELGYTIRMDEDTKDFIVSWERDDTFV